LARFSPDRTGKDPGYQNSVRADLIPGKRKIVRVVVLAQWYYWHQVTGVYEESCKH
jgi:hypothetical protein